MFLRRPEKVGWYLWTVLRSQLEEGADSEEELWVTDESDTETEESDSGDGEGGEYEEREGSRETKRE